jgi:hypothetical protein
MKRPSYLLVYGNILLCVVLITLLGFNKKTSESPNIHNVIEGQKIPYTILLNNVSRTSWKNENTLQQMFHLIEKENDFNTLFSEIHDTTDPISSPFPPTELKNIDYKNEIGIVISRGYHASDTYGVKVNDIRVNKNFLTIYVELMNPAEGFSLATSDYRLSLLKIKKSDIPDSINKCELRDQINNISLISISFQ